MSHSYVTRSVTRRLTQMDVMSSKIDNMAADVNNSIAYYENNVIDMVHTAIKCPDVLAYAPVMREAMTYFVHESLREATENQRLIAAAEEFYMFIEQLATRPDYVQ